MFLFCLNVLINNYKAHWRLWKSARRFLLQNQIWQVRFDCEPTQARATYAFYIFDM